MLSDWNYQTNCNTKGRSSSTSPQHLHQHMQPPIPNKSQQGEPTTTPLVNKPSTAGKFSNPYFPYHLIACINAIDMKSHTINLNQRKTSKSEHSPLQSPYTRVYGKWWVFDKTNNTTYIKIKRNENANINWSKHNVVITKPPIILIKLKPKITYSYKQRNYTYNLVDTLTRGNSCINKMTGQGKGAVKIFTEDPNFIMMDSSSPPQGHKRTGGNKTSSEEKRTKATAEKRGKSKEKNQPTPQFWLGFEAMERIAIDGGAPRFIESAPIQKKGR